MKHPRFDLRTAHGEGVPEGTRAVMLGHFGPVIAAQRAPAAPRVDHRSPEARARREARRPPPT